MIADKIGPHHLERKAILYVRQSSAHQALHNRESGMLQYAMRDRLTALGFAEIEVIDDDLGRSAAGGVQRAGFERMVAEVCLGKVGAVCAREVSRFARNSRDWQQLIEMCRVVDTVLVDQETIYAPRHGTTGCYSVSKRASTSTSSTFCANVRCPPVTRKPVPVGPASKQTCSRLYRSASLLIARSIGSGLFSTSPRNRTSPVRPPSATAIACLFLATSKATKASLCFPMVRPPCMRLGSVRPSNPRSYLHERAGHRLSPRMTSSS